MPHTQIPLPRNRLETALRPIIDDEPPAPPPEPRPPSVSLPVRIVCRIAQKITAEMVMIAGSRMLERRDRRRMLCHVRQISMYACHTALQFSQQEIAGGFGRHRTTVAHACMIVEQRRDDPAFDDFVSAIERTVVSVFRFPEGAAHD
ncbi:helix-turn-helix domain-containing protein [Rhizobium sp. RAF36]|jgi:hypothetical protein|uniref:helix-turn-helix domain-containing protein n=1 Tax=Rhizobium sp. RAF36 TaxID=3233055 RepID=UPI003F9DA094